ncbi:MAG: 2-hydroxychromene-2-carboxylate isomerase [Kofleriaceae bacterium]
MGLHDRTRPCKARAPVLELWFDFSCPYAYLASQQASRLAARGVEIDWRPMLLGGVFRGIGAGDGPMATLSAPKARHNAADMHRWAEVIGAPFRLPDTHPMRTVRALRVLLGLPHREWPAAIHALYATYWQRAEDITHDAVIRAALATAGIDTNIIDGAFATADSDAIKNELRARTDEAIALGVFGAPAWIVRRESAPLLIWGQDRITWVEAVLAGWDPDRDPPPGGARTVDATPAASGATLDVYFDVSSPFAYLGLTQLPALARATGVTPRLVPILLGALFKDLQQANVPWFAMPVAKQRYLGVEMSRWAHWWGQPFVFPKKFPQRTVNAQRLAILAAEQSFESGVQLAIALGRAMWAEQRDLEDTATLAQIIAETQSSDAWITGITEPEVKARLAENTASAKAAGVFGVPTFVVNGRHLFWGQDRMGLVARALAGWSPAY